MKLLSVHKLMSWCLEVLLTVLLLSLTTTISPLQGGTDEPFADSDPPPTEDSDVLTDSPRFVVRLPDNNLLCFAIDGFELFTYNLITSHYLVVNGFLDLAEYRHKDPSGPTMKKGFTEVGVIIRSIDKRMKGGSRVFKHRVSGPKKKAFLEKFGEVDIHGGAVVFGLDKDGRSSIESEQAKHETFQVKLDKPKVVVKAVSGDGNTFRVYLEDSSGLTSTGSHGLLGQFYLWPKHICNTLTIIKVATDGFICILTRTGQFLSPKVRINSATGELTLSNGSSVAVERGVVWRSLKDGVYPGHRCWYPKQGTTVLQGNSWDYIIEHIMSTQYKYTLF